MCLIIGLFSLLTPQYTILAERVPEKPKDNSSTCVPNNFSDAKSFLCFSFFWYTCDVVKMIFILIRYRIIYINIYDEAKM